MGQNSRKPKNIFFKSLISVRKFNFWPNYRANLEILQFLVLTCSIQLETFRRHSVHKSGKNDQTWAKARWSDCLELGQMPKLDFEPK